MLVYKIVLDGKMCLCLLLLITYKNFDINVIFDCRIIIHSELASLLCYYSIVPLNATNGRASNNQGFWVFIHFIPLNSISSAFLHQLLKCNVLLDYQSSCVNCLVPITILLLMHRLFPWQINLYLFGKYRLYLFGKYTDYWLTSMMNTDLANLIPIWPMLWIIFIWKFLTFISEKSIFNVPSDYIKNFLC
jgi:hypothetical protein